MIIEACVYGEARVCGKARVYGEARVCGEAKVFDEACVCYKANITDRYSILLVSNIGSRIGTTTFFKTRDNKIYVVCGYFIGTIEEFEAVVRKMHGDRKHGLVYRSAIQVAKETLA